jgi:hypothetical protein
MRQSILRGADFPEMAGHALRRTASRAIAHRDVAVMLAHVARMPERDATPVLAEPCGTLTAGSLPDHAMERLSPSCGVVGWPRDEHSVEPQAAVGAASGMRAPGPRNTEHTPTDRAAHTALQLTHKGGTHDEAIKPSSR